MNIVNISAGAYWDNDVKTVAETDKAIQLEVVGDKRFIDCVGVKAWFPKAALEITEYDTSDAGRVAFAKVKPWFLAKMTLWQDRVTGRAGR
jgi:hypothetical protein